MVHPIFGAYIYFLADGADDVVVALYLVHSHFVVVAETFFTSVDTTHIVFIGVRFVMLKSGLSGAK